MICPSCGHQNKVNRFCTRCGLHLMPLSLRNPFMSAVAINSAETAELNKNVSPNFATQRLDVAQTQPILPRVTMAERATTRLHDMVVTTSKSARPYVSVMLAASLLVFVVAAALWRSVNIPTQNIAFAAAQTSTAHSFAPIATPAHTPAVVLPVSPWSVIEGETQAVINADNALHNDQQFAVLEPNGQLALTLTDDQFFGNGAGADVQIHGADAQQPAYRVFVRDDANAAWQRIDVNRKSFVQGKAQHDMGHHGITRARQLLIRNDSTSTLQVDGIVAVYPNLIVAAKHTHRH